MRMGELSPFSSSPSSSSKRRICRCTRSILLFCFAVQHEMLTRDCIFYLAA